MRKYWDHLRGSLARRVQYKITRGGLLFSLAILVVGFGAVVSANNLLFLIVATMLATLLVSGFVSRLCLAGLELDFLVPEHVPAGRSVPGKLFVRNQKWLMPSFSIRVEGIRDPGSPTLKSGVYFPLIAAGATIEETVEVRFPRRGAYRQNSFAFSTSFPFGFLEKSARVTLRREMIVYPSIDPQPGFDDLFVGISGEIETHYRGLGRTSTASAPTRRSRARAMWTGKPPRTWAACRSASSRASRSRPSRFFWTATFRPTGRLVRARHRLLRLPRVATVRTGRGHPFPLQRLRLPAAGGRRHLYHSQVPGDGLSAAGKAPEAPLDETSYKIVFTPSPRRFSEAGWVGARVLAPDSLPVPGAPALTPEGSD